MKQKILGFLFLLIFFAGTIYGQEKEKYIFGTEQKLEMIVHVFGEVRQPGEFRVDDNTNVLELISKAGGPTQFSNLAGIRITRFGLIDSASKGNDGKSARSAGSNYKFGKRIIKINIDDYLNDDNYRDRMPILHPGDVVFVPRNNWYRWRNIVGVARDLSVIVSVYFIYLRATQD